VKLSLKQSFYFWFSDTEGWIACCSAALESTAISWVVHTAMGAKMGFASVQRWPNLTAVLLSVWMEAALFYYQFEWE